MSTLNVKPVMPEGFLKGRRDNVPGAMAPAVLSMPARKTVNILTPVNAVKNVIAIIVGHQHAWIMLP
jgi:hypothetical protein